MRSVVETSLVSNATLTAFTTRLTMDVCIIMLLYRRPWIDVDSVSKQWRV